jgi:SAM-dependent methyltransferase
MGEADETHSGDWMQELDQLRRRYPSPVAFAYEWWHYNAPFVENLRTTVSPPARIIEVGTGTGALSVLLAACGYDVVGIDREPAIVESAQELASHFRVACRFEVGDGFDLSRYANRFDLAFSGGVLEHFTATEAVALLRQQAVAARYVMAIIPTWYALRNDPATEPTHARRIWRPELEHLFRDADLRIVRRFGYGVPGGRFEPIFRFMLPGAVQWLLQNRLSYAATLGCIGERDLA